MVKRRGMLMEPFPQSAGVAMVLEFPVWGVLGTTVALITVWFLGTSEALIDSAIEDMGWVMTGVEGGGGGGGGRSSLLHMFVVQHLEVQLTIVCPWFVKVVFFILHTYLGSGWLQTKSRPHCLSRYRISSPLLFLTNSFMLKHWFQPAAHVTDSRFVRQSLKELSWGHLWQERAWAEKIKQQQGRWQCWFNVTKCRP